MRDKIIRFNNDAAIVFVVLFPLVAAWLAGPGGIVVQGLAAAGAFVLACVCTGVWFVLVGIYDELKYANAAARAKVAITRDELRAPPNGKPYPPSPPSMRVGDKTKINKYDRENFS